MLDIILAAGLAFLAGAGLTLFVTRKHIDNIIMNSTKDFIMAYNDGFKDGTEIAWEDGRKFGIQEEKLMELFRTRHQP